MPFHHDMYLITDPKQHSWSGKGRTPTASQTMLSPTGRSRQHTRGSHTSSVGPHSAHRWAQDEETNRHPASCILGHSSLCWKGPGPWTARQIHPKSPHSSFGPRSHISRNEVPAFFESEIAFHRPYYKETFPEPGCCLKEL